MHDSDTTFRIRVDLAYDGTSYHGWATQPGLPTVHEPDEMGLGKIFRQPIKTTVAGRTDAGVHAARQVIQYYIAPQQWEKLTSHNSAPPPLHASVQILNETL